MRQLYNKNIFSYLSQKSLISFPILRYLSCTKVKNTSIPIDPVKLSFASYESMSDSEAAMKPPILIMHGLFGSKNNWNSLAKAIHQKTNHKVIALDARNHGDSPHTSEHTYYHLAQDVVEILNDLKIPKAILIGHSMGGSAMMCLALNFPKLVDKLIVVDMSPIRTSPSLEEMHKIFQAMKNVKFTELQSLTKARKAAEEQLAASAIKPLALRQFLITNLVESETGEYKWRVNLPVLEENFPNQIATFPNISDKIFSGPTLFIGGGNSDYIRKEDHIAIKQLFPAAEFHYIANANHWVHADKPVEFLSIVTQFVNKFSG